MNADPPKIANYYTIPVKALRQAELARGVWRILALADASLRDAAVRDRLLGSPTNRGACAVAAVTTYALMVRSATPTMERRIWRLLNSTARRKGYPGYPKLEEREGIAGAIILFDDIESCLRRVIAGKEALV